MKKGIYLVFFIIVIALVSYFYFNRTPVKIIDIHENSYAPVVVVNSLPFLDAEKIKWWRTESKNIIDRNDEAQKHSGSINYYIYRFGEGYQELGKKDRLCFPDIKPPKNCLDKEILMIVRYRKNSDIQFDIDKDAYILNQKGELNKLD